MEMGGEGELLSPRARHFVGSRLRPGSGRVHYVRFHGPGLPGWARPCRVGTALVFSQTNWHNLRELSTLLSYSFY